MSLRSQKHLKYLKSSFDNAIATIIKYMYISFFLSQLILTHHFPFKLNAKVMQVLISIFLYHDFSVRNFIKGIQVHIGFQVVFREFLEVVHKRAVYVSPQLALLEHFHSQPLSVLCCQKKEALLNVMQFGCKDLERIRTLPSFKRCWADRTDIFSCGGSISVFQT